MPSAPNADHKVDVAADEIREIVRANGRRVWHGAARILKLPALNDDHGSRRITDGRLVVEEAELDVTTRVSKGGELEMAVLRVVRHLLEIHRALEVESREI